VPPASKQRSTRTGPRWWRKLQWKIFFPRFVFLSTAGDRCSILQKLISQFLGLIVMSH
jgi:hypothetical protein